MPGVYISYPFCSQKCTYCNFASGVFSGELEHDYVEALATEITSHPWQWVPETVYLGGGTPGRMRVATLDRLLRLVPGRPWVEATIEAAPGNLDLETARAWREAGITRVSLGVQSFVQRELARSGRKHTAAIVEQETRILADSGIQHVNIDLIAGLAGQTIESWEESLGWIERLRPDHVSVYMLEVDSDSRLGGEILSGGDRYGARNVPADETIAEMYEAAVDKLGTLGFARYEISNFALPGCESRHNLKYWRLEPYVGFGADAHSYDCRSRWSNVENPADYVRSAGSPRKEPADAGANERLYIGLRLSEGVRPAEADWRRFDEPIRRFVDAGLLERDGKTLRLTSRGVLLSNEVFQEFIETC